MRKMENLTDIDDIDSFTRPYRGYWNFSQGCTIVCGIILIYIYMILDLRQNFTDSLEQTSKKPFFQPTNSSIIVVSKLADESFQV